VPAPVSTTGERLDLRTGAPSPVESSSLSRFDLDFSPLEEHDEDEHAGGKWRRRQAAAQGVGGAAAPSRRAPALARRHAP
jgi:hypothetical protein